jgi:HAE1 family hydrophobic/amphiphilic exporter-1
MKLPEFSVKRRVTITMVFVAILIFGILCMKRLKLDMLPKITPPVISVITFYPGANASDVESNVTKYLEDELTTVNNLDKITSISKDNLSVVNCTFKWGTNLDTASNDARDKVDLAKPRLPDDVEKSLIFKFSSSSFPIVIASITAKESYPQLYQITDKMIADPLKRVPGVGTVILRAGLERQINVFLHKDKLEAYDISIQRIKALLKAENINLPAGNIKTGRFDYNLRIVGRFKTPREIKNLVVGEHKGHILYMRDIATIKDSFKEQIEKAWGDGRPGMVLMIQKQSEANTVEVVDAVMAKLKDIQKRIPSDVGIKIIIDSARDIRNSIRDLSKTVYIGGLLVILITLLFLRKFRASLIITLTIPFSLIIAFIFLYIFNYTINIISIMSLSIAIGMVVDNAIVVLENIMRHIDEGETPHSASVFGASEVGLAISASTLTTVVVFVPLIFVKGISGIIFHQLAAVVTITLLGSLFTSLTLTPMLSAAWLDRPGKGKGNPLLSFLYAIGEKILTFFEGIYSTVLSFSLSHRWLIILTGIIIFVFSMNLLRFTGSEFLPSMDSGDMEVNFRLKEGTRLEETQKVAIHIMEIFEKEIPEMDNYYALVGQSREGVATALGFEEGSYVGRVGAKLVPKSQRKRSVKEVANAIRKDIEKIPGIKYLAIQVVSPVEKLFFGGGRKPISLEVLGSNSKTIVAVAHKLKALIEKIPGAVDVTTSERGKRPEIWIRLDRQKAAVLGLNMALVADTVRTAFYGNEPTKFRDAGDDYDIFVRLSKNDRRSLKDIGNITVYATTGKPIKLKNVAIISQRYGPIQIDRKNRQRIVTVDADTFGRSMGEVMGDIREKLKSFPLPPGVEIREGSDVEEQQKSFRDLRLLFLLGIVLVFMVMAAQFESFRDPFVIMFAVPFALVGVVWAFFLTHTTLNLMSFIGVIMLIGIVVNNAIVLVDYTNILRKRGIALFDAARIAGTRRLRPVLMTTFTTIFGMLPMALSRGEGSEAWNPMGITVIGGLMVSTFVTLLFVPVLYTFFTRKDIRKSLK